MIAALQLLNQNVYPSQHVYNVNTHNTDKCFFTTTSYTFEYEMFNPRSEFLSFQTCKFLKAFRALHINTK